MSDYLNKRRQWILDGKPVEKKKPKPIPKKSAKKIEVEKKEREERGGGDTDKERWFKRRRHEMVGVCQCGCAMPSSKYDDKNFRSSICHIFPQRLFPSVQFHHLNWVERKFWATATTSACHTNMDNKSMDLWPNFADWDDIKEKYHQLVPLLTDEEKSHKFYHHLTFLIYKS